MNFGSIMPLLSQNKTIQCWSSAECSASSCMVMVSEWVSELLCVLCAVTGH